MSGNGNCCGIKAKKIEKLLRNVREKTENLKVDNEKIFDAEKIFVICLKIKKGNNSLNVEKFYYDEGKKIWQKMEGDDLPNINKNQKGVYIVVDVTGVLDNENPIIYIGGQRRDKKQGISGRLNNFINEFKLNCKWEFVEARQSQHSGAQLIKCALKVRNVQEIKFLILGFPLTENTNIEIVEALFHGAFFEKHAQYAKYVSSPKKLPQVCRKFFKENKESVKQIFEEVNKFTKGGSQDES